MRVDIYISSTIRGPYRRTGKVIYLLSTRTEKGRDVVTDARITELEQATETKLTLYALRDALYRFTKPSDIMIHTECTQVTAAINRDWVKAWKENAWRNAKGKPVKEAELWQDILDAAEDLNHTLYVTCGIHEYSQWMQDSMRRVCANKDTFTVIDENLLYLVGDRY